MLLLEGTLAADLDDRALIVEATYFLVYDLSVIAAFFSKNGVKMINVMVNTQMTFVFTYALNMVLRTALLL